MLALGITIPVRLFPVGYRYYSYALSLSGELIFKAESPFSIKFELLFDFTSFNSLGKRRRIGMLGFG